jgi:hypothetical protein
MTDAWQTDYLPVTSHFVLGLSHLGIRQHTDDCLPSIQPSSKSRDVTAQILHETVGV